MRRVLATFAVLGVAIACGGSYGTGSSDPPVDDGGLPDGPVADAPLGADGSSSGCSPRTAPAGVVGLRVRVDTLRIGDDDKTGIPTQNGWRTVGYDLDGLCTTQAGPPACRRLNNASPSSQEDGDLGIDNNFAKTIVPQILGLVGSSTTIWEGKSYLEVDPTTRAGAFVIIAAGAVFRVPLVDVHNTGDAAQGTIAAVVPLDAFLDEIRKSAGRVDASLCAGATIDSIFGQMQQASDILTTGTPNDASDCNGISFGMDYTGTTVPSIPVDTPSPCTDGG